MKLSFARSLFGILKRMQHLPTASRNCCAIMALAVLIPAHVKCGQTDSPPALTSTISGSVVDETGAAIVGAEVKLSHLGDKSEWESLSGNAGQFTFAAVASGPFEVIASAPGFADQVLRGVVATGESSKLSPIVLTLSLVTATVQVRLTQVELAQEQIRVQEQQRIFGLLPNFFVSYLPDAEPLTTKQKFELAWKSTLDPAAFAVSAIIAGVQQSNDDFSGYGQGASGYAKRYAASYGNFLTGTYVSGAILPFVFRQDPRYFYKGTGSARSRVLYALSRSVIAKGDNQKWQPAYSNILGSLASAGISNLYYPAKDRDGISLTFENLVIGIGSDAVSNLFQEFVVRRLTPHSSLRAAAKP